MKFTRLRLSGFKSFVEPTELFIEPGLSAVIGPNGCGKSNLFDAMRWVMGETRPSSVRGSEMDDVIFSGSGGRPARNVAEVTIFIDNKDRTAAAFEKLKEMTPPADEDGDGGSSSKRPEGEITNARLKELEADPAVRLTTIDASHHCMLTHVDRTMAALIGH